MDLFNKGSSRPVKLTVRHDRLRDLKRGYPWVFAHSLTDLPPAAPGSFALLRDRDRSIIAKGMYDRDCPLAFRVCALDEELSNELIHAKLSRALSLRRSVLSSDTT